MLPLVWLIIGKDRDKNLVNPSDSLVNAIVIVKYRRSRHGQDLLGYENRINMWCISQWSFT